MEDQELQALLGELLAEAEERTARVEQLLLELPRRPAGERSGLASQARRELHTLKGNAGMMGFDALQLAAHELEDLVEGLDLERPDVQASLAGIDRLRHETGALGRRRGDAAGAVRTADGVRIAYDRLDALDERLGAQLVARHRMAEALAAAVAEHGAGRGRRPAGEVDSLERCAQAWHDLDRLLDQLQEQLLDLRMVPVSTLFGRLRRLVHDEGHKSGKQVRLETRGGDTPVDRALIDAAAEVLGHLARNAVVHGIELPEGRRQASKPPQGMVRVEARVRSESVEIDVLDDGGGIDREGLRRAAKEAGLDVGEADLQALMFHAGLTTRRDADLSAGRGVGMDVVLDGVRRCGGTIEVASRPGVGTRFRLRLPLSVSIAKVLLVSADGREYALPVSAILDTLAPPDLAGRTSLVWRGRELPLLDLGVALGSRREPRSDGFVVVSEAGGRLLGLQVGATRGPLEIMVRGLDDLLQGLPGVSGSSVLGDGRVVLILDPTSLATLRRSAVGEAA